MAWYDGMMDTLGRAIAGYMTSKRVQELERSRAYYDGRQKRQIKVKPEGMDDNLVLNFTSLVVNRSVSRLLRGKTDWRLPEGETAQEEYLDDVWDVNKREALMLQLALNGAVSGTPYVKIVPDGKANPFTGRLVPRIIALDPEYMTIETNPHDAEDVIAYIIEYVVDETRYKEVSRKAQADDGDGMAGTWIVENWELGKATYGKWKLMNSQQWPYDFPPIHHWKNLPALKSVYGMSDIDDVLEVQDRTNFVASNISKIIRNQAHKQRYKIGPGAPEKMEWGIDNIVSFQPGNEIGQLDATADLASSSDFMGVLRQSMFDVSRETDLSSLGVNVGNLTNFGLRVLYNDAIDKNDTKRQLYGDAFLEINRRLLVLAGYEGEASNPGVMVWGEPLPVNTTEELQSMQVAINLGLISKQTAAEKLGYDWEQEQERMDAEKTSDVGGVGAFLLRNFNRGAGTEQPAQPEQAQAQAQTPGTEARNNGQQQTA